MGKRVATALVIGLAFLLPLAAQQPGTSKAVQAKQGMVVTVSPPATDVGVEILKRGGNAVDASIAVAFALAVTWPEAGNIGCGGFMLVWPGKKGEPEVIDYRETAPAAATRAATRPSRRRASRPRGVRRRASRHRTAPWSARW